MTSSTKDRRAIELQLLVGAAVSLAAIAVAAAAIDKTLAALGAACFAIIVMWVGARATASGRPLDIMHHTTRLTAVTMAWAGAALLVGYPIAGLLWLHGWQYGLGALLLAAGFGYFAQRFSNDRDVLSQPKTIEIVRRLAALQSLAIILALCWLIFSGKLATFKGDWLANDVFLATAAAILVLSLLFVMRGRELPR